MNFDTVWQLIRYGLIAVGGIAVGRGMVTQDEVITIVGALGQIATVAWGVYVKAGTTAVPDKTAERKDVPTVSAATGQVIPGSATSK